MEPDTYLKLHVGGSTNLLGLTEARHHVPWQALDKIKEDVCEHSA
jgi:hypothetical protein